MGELFYRICYSGSDLFFLFSPVFCPPGCSKLQHKRSLPRTEDNIMKKQTFYVNLSDNAFFPSGEIVADDQAITYKTYDLTVPAEYLSIEMKYTDIGYIYHEKKRFFPAVIVHMTDGKNYKFIFSFARKKFYELMKSKGVTVNV